MNKTFIETEEEIKEYIVQLLKEKEIEQKIIKKIQ